MKRLRKIALMHSLFGKCEEHICKECDHFVEGRYHSRVLRKCEVYGLTHSEASDWAQKHTACGMFNKEYSGEPIIKLYQPVRRELVQVAGQLTMFEE